VKRVYPTNNQPKNQGKDATSEEVQRRKGGRKYDLLKFSRMILQKKKLKSCDHFRKSGVEVRGNFRGALYEYSYTPIE